MIDKATAKTAKALHLIISQSDRETVSRGRAGGRWRGTEKRAKRRQKTNTARTASRPHNKTETHIHVWQHESVCVCVFVACWLSNDIREAVAIPAVCFLCIVIRPMEAGTYVFLFDDDVDDGCVPQQAVCHMAAAQVGICSILFGGFVLLANPLPRQHTAMQDERGREKQSGKREKESERAK